MSRGSISLFRKGYPEHLFILWNTMNNYLNTIKKGVYIKENWSEESDEEEIRKAENST